MVRNELLFGEFKASFRGGIFFVKPLCDVLFLVSMAIVGEDRIFHRHAGDGTGPFFLK
jgi:hypothetical protein